MCRNSYHNSINHNLDFLKGIFTLKETIRPTREECKLNLEIPEYYQVIFECFLDQSWEQLKLKFSENLKSFKDTEKME